MSTSQTTSPSSSSSAEGAPTARFPSLLGLVAAAVGLGLGEAIAGVADLVSPVVAVGDVVVDNVPEPVKQLAIDLFGTNDKIALLVGIVVILALAALGIGRVAARRRGVALALTGLFGVIGVAAVLLAPESDALDLLPSVVAGVAAVGTLWWFTAPASELPGQLEGRRSLLRDVSIGAGVAVVGAVLGRFVTAQRAASLETTRANVELPPPVEPVDLPDDLQVDVEGAVPWQTPNDEFYRIDTRLDTPMLERAGWTLTVTGMVDNPLTLGIDQLEERYEVIERAITMSCVSNEVGGELVGNALWRGVRLADVLDEAGVADGATQLVGRAFDDFTTGFPVERAYDRDAMIVVGMNGEPLPPAHGYPLRMVVPGLYGYVSATKWLTEIELTTFDAFDQYWVERGWEQRAPIKTQSRIDTPAGFAQLSGVVPIAGVAWAQTRGIERVEVRIDDGPWREARLAPSFNDITWRQWVFEWDTAEVEPGRHDIQVRATDGTGETQTDERQEPFPDGATGWHQLAVSVVESPSS